MKFFRFSFFKPTWLSRTIFWFI